MSVIIKPLTDSQYLDIVSEKATKHRTNRSNWTELIDQFLESELNAAEVISDNEYANSTTLYTTLMRVISYRDLDALISVTMINGRVLLIKK